MNPDADLLADTTFRLTSKVLLTSTVATAASETVKTNDEWKTGGHIGKAEAIDHNRRAASPFVRNASNLPINNSDIKL